ncbi:uncharacterized protein LOC110843505 [Folsomia candida]|uniref:uncharacterized protein LOC110843505 n=1 Tax=Folsomia candida TaxID=158441 RepID=UPI0016051648|nr:uncharacterized protein LOC110843505 [Folsomia candida]
MILPTTATVWSLCLIFGTVITHTESNEDLIVDNSNSTSLESPESIHDSWVKIPTDWRPSEEGTTSSEQYLPSHAQASFYSSGSSGGSSYRRGSYGHGPKSGGGNGPDGQPEPYFDHAMMTNLSEHLGSHAYLRCRVKNLGDRTVSWIRRRDWHILTTGRTVYTTDDRFQIIHHDGSDEWSLVIRYTQRRDAGEYECQVSNPHGVIAHFFNLNVLVPQAYILGAKEYHVQQGTVISLVCIIENSPRLVSQYLYWYHNNQMINLIGSGISVHTENGVHIHSRLTVPQAGPQHAGTYTCNATNTESATVQVYVSDGDKTAAIQRATGSHFVPASWTIFLVLLMILLRVEGGCR